MKQQETAPKRKRKPWGRYRKGTFTPVKFYLIDGRIRCIRDYDA